MQQSRYQTLLGACVAALAGFAAANTLAHPGGGILALDSDGDGQVSYEEFRLPEREGKHPLFTRADADGDGAITRDEMLAAIDEISEERGEKVRDGMLQRFDETDADGNGVVTMEETRQQIFARIDANNDGFLTEDEARAMHEKRRGMRERRKPVS